MSRYDPYRHSRPVWWAQLLFMFAAAAVFVVGLWIAFAFLLSLAEYIPSLP